MVDTALTILASIGVGGAIVFALSSWLGKVWATRIMLGEQHELASRLEEKKTELQASSALQLEERKAELEGQITAARQEFRRQIEHVQAQYELDVERNKAKAIRYSESQFRLYNELWVSLTDLERRVEDLWVKVSPGEVRKLAEQIASTKAAVRRNALLIEDTHYQKLEKLLIRFEEFQFGKARLLQLRSGIDQEGGFDPGSIRGVIENNRDARDELRTLLLRLSKSFKRQMRGDETIDGVA